MAGRAGRANRNLPCTLAVYNLRNPFDPGVGENVRLVAAGAGELRDDGALVARLEPVQRIRRDGVLIAGVELDLVEDRVVLFAADGDAAFGVRRRVARGPRPRAAPP